MEFWYLFTSRFGLSVFISITEALTLCKALPCFNGVTKSRAVFHFLHQHSFSSNFLPQHFQDHTDLSLSMVPFAL